MQIDIAISDDISCMDIAHLGEGNQGEVLVCGEETGTLQSVNSDKILHKQSIGWKKWSVTHFLFNLYLGLDLVGNCKSAYALHS